MFENTGDFQVLETVILTWRSTMLNKFTMDLTEYRWSIVMY